MIHGFVFKHPTSTYVSRSLHKSGCANPFRHSPSPNFDSHSPELAIFRFINFCLYAASVHKSFLHSLLPRRTDFDVPTLSRVLSPQRAAPPRFIQKYTNEVGTVKCPSQEFRNSLRPERLVRFGRKLRVSNSRHPMAAEKLPHPLCRV